MLASATKKIIVTEFGFSFCETWFKTTCYEETVENIFFLYCPLHRLQTSLSNNQKQKQRLLTDLHPDYNTSTRSCIILFKNGKCFTKHVQPFAITVDTNYRNKKKNQKDLIYYRMQWHSSAFAGRKKSDA